MTINCFDYTISSTPPGPGHPVWVPNSSCRGTFDIVSLCFSTTIICVWTSLHWDIQLERVGSQPPLKCFNTTLPMWLSNIRRLIGQYTLFVGVAIFCPERLLYNATSQLFCAWKLRNCFSNVLKEISDKNRAADIQSHVVGPHVSFYCSTPSTSF